MICHVYCSQCVKYIGMFEHNDNASYHTIRAGGYTMSVCVLCYSKIVYEGEPLKGPRMKKPCLKCKKPMEISYFPFERDVFRSFVEPFVDKDLTICADCRKKEKEPQFPEFKIPIGAIVRATIHGAVDGVQVTVKKKKWVVGHRWFLVDGMGPGWGGIVPTASGECVKRYIVSDSPYDTSDRIELSEDLLEIHP